MPTHERIKRKREELGMSQEELLERLKPLWPKHWRKLRKNVLSMIENGDRRVLVDEVPYFARALGCRTEDLHDPQPQ